MVDYFKGTKEHGTHWEDLTTVIENDVDPH